MTDPKTLTPESLYELQSETYAKGYLTGAYDERLRIIDLIRNTYTDSKHEEWGSLEWTQDIIKLIQGEP